MQNFGLPSYSLLNKLIKVAIKLTAQMAAQVLTEVLTEVPSCPERPIAPLTGISSTISVNQFALFKANSCGAYAST